ncbi:MAG TPA: HEPN domain-containing protein [Terracidiphilus sp.]|nr:HEPN domain-containing protein [Terracidiphilus sp.]
MSTFLLRTKSGIEDCARHLSATATSGTEIESYLTQHLLVVLCAEIQQEIYGIVETRATASGDTALSSFAVASARKTLRSIKKSEIVGFVRMFGVDANSQIALSIDDAEVNFFNNAVEDRHGVAHRQGAQITFHELIRAVAVAEKLLEAVQTCLGQSVPLPQPRAISTN